MRKRAFIFFIALALVLIFPVGAAKVDKLSADATHILIGKVKKVDSYYGTNEWSEELIFSYVKVKVEKKLKGELGEDVDFVVEGGSVGELTLKVSEYPLFAEGQKIKLYLKKEKDKFKYVESEDIEESEKPAKPEKPGKPGGGRTKCCKTFAHWTTPNVPYFVNPENGDVNSNCALSDIEAGALPWNSVSGINLSYAGSTGAAQINQNFINEIFFSPQSSGGTIAVTYTWYYTFSGEIIEFDMKFYDGGWNFFGLTCKDSCTGGFYIQTIAVHELGHAIGIDHNRCNSSIMYPYASYCETNSLSADDEACAQSLYGK